MIEKYNCFEELTSMVEHLSTHLDDVNKIMEELPNKIVECRNYCNYNIEERADEIANDVIKDAMATLNEIIKQAESCDYGLEGWRTLKTKADLIAAIKKEVIDDI